jgi:hypothetical protein
VLEEQRLEPVLRAPIAVIPVQRHPAEPHGGGSGAGRDDQRTGVLPWQTGLPRLPLRHRSVEKISRRAVIARRVTNPASTGWVASQR